MAGAAALAVVVVIGTIIVVSFIGKSDDPNTREYVLCEDPPIEPNCAETSRRGDEISVDHSIESAQVGCVEGVPQLLLELDPGLPPAATFIVRRYEAWNLDEDGRRSTSRPIGDRARYVSAILRASTDEEEQRVAALPLPAWPPGELYGHLAVWAKWQMPIGQNYASTIADVPASDASCD